MSRAQPGGSTAASRDRIDRTDRIDLRLVALVAAGLGLVAVYTAGTAAIPLNRYFPGDQGITLDFVKMLDTGWAGDSIRYVGFVAAAFTLYAVAVAVAWSGRVSIPGWVLWGFPVAFALSLLLMYPPTAVDMFHYDADARTLWIHGQNPLIVPPAANPYPIGISWHDLPSPYGPWWQMIAGLPVLVGRDDYLLGLVAFKAMAAAFYAGSAWIIWRLVKRTRPGQEALALVLFAWNPFVLLAVVGNGHNDIVMVFFALVAIERAHQRDWNFAFLGLTLSVLIKFATALLGPPLLLYAWYQTPGDWRARTKAVGPALAISAIVAVLLYAPFWQGAATFDTLRGQTELWITSTPLTLRALLDNFMPVGDAERAARFTMLMLFALIYIPVTWQARRSFDHLVVAGFTVLFAYLLMVAVWFRPWYLLWPLGLAALRPRSGLGAIFIVAAFAASFPSLIEQYRYEVITFDWDDVSAVVVGFAPPAVVWLIWAARSGSWTLGAIRARPASPAIAVQPRLSPAGATADGASAASVRAASPRPEESVAPEESQRG